MSRIRHLPPASAQRGIALLVVLIMLLLLTLLSTAGMRETTLQNRVAGNFVERQHAGNAAESALREGERRLLTLANTGVVNTGFANCGSSASALKTSVRNLCVLDADPFRELKKAGADWWTADTYALNYTGSDSASNFASTPRWNAAYIGAGTTDYEALLQGKGTYYYRVTAVAKADGERFPVIHQSVLRVNIQ
jgi:type IV pilus assembly protein PilX